MYGFSSNMRSKLVGLRRTRVRFLCIFVFFVRLVAAVVFVDAYSYDTYILAVRCIKQNKDAVWSLVFILLLVTGVRADPKHSYSYDIIYLYVREDCFFLFYIEIFHIFSRYLVVGSRHVFFFRFQ